MGVFMQIFEKKLEYIIAIIVFIICLYFQLAAPSNFCDILAQSISVSSIIVGFLVAAKSILIALDDKPIIRRLKELKKYNTLVNYFFNAIILSFIWALCSGILLFFPISTFALYHHVIMAGWMGLAVGSISACAKIVNLLGKILKSES